MVITKFVYQYCIFVIFFFNCFMLLIARRDEVQASTITD